MLGEVPPRADSGVVIRGTVAQVPQVSWIFNATVSSSISSLNACKLRENVLFGSKFEPARYWKAIDLTELQHDLYILPFVKHGDQQPSNHTLPADQD
ncbi:hypothetical protein L3X38_035062 [Prunus dulcis]|uniref:Uncharacterized protein n=1 Tax=Prunus dulcis TaxID=3755 RepID=A0AAD4YZ52_PRUDU|nr:hypothetical protein L3X38_035062 [Prunus dulcis]